MTTKNDVAGIVDRLEIEHRATCEALRGSLKTFLAGGGPPDPALRAYATSAQPRLQAAYNQFLSTYMSGITPGAPPNADYLVSQLQRLTDQVLGKPGARFLVGSILMN